VEKWLLRPTSRSAEIKPGEGRGIFEKNLIIGNPGAAIY